MSWPELFDSSRPGSHELAKACGVRMIPTMLLINKRGIVRPVNAREDLRTHIRQLLEEK